MTNDVIKSVKRVLEVLELFREEKRPLNATDISKKFNYPKSSCSALLKSLVSLGYLTVDSQNTQYFPTVRISKLGDWLPQMLFGKERMDILEELQAKTGETVTLSIRNGFSMQFVSVLPGSFSITLAVEEGETVPLFGTAIGTALLSTYPQERVESLLERADAAHIETALKLPLKKIDEDIKKARRNGYALGYDRILSDTGAIAMAMTHDDNVVVICVGGLTSRIRREEKEIISKMRTLVSKPLN